MFVFSQTTMQNVPVKRQYVVQFTVKCVVYIVEATEQTLIIVNRRCFLLFIVNTFPRKPLDNPFTKIQYTIYSNAYITCVRIYRSICYFFATSAVVLQVGDQQYYNKSMYKVKYIIHKSVCNRTLLQRKSYFRDQFALTTYFTIHI